MADYSTDADLLIYEPEILTQGVADFNTYHAFAKVDIDRILKAEWWPGALRSWADGQPYDFTTKMLVSNTDFDPQYLKNPDQLKAASCFRVFGWYAFEILAKYDDAEPDRWEKKKDVYQDRFKGLKAFHSLAHQAEQGLNLHVQIGGLYGHDLFEASLLKNLLLRLLPELRS